MNHYVVVPIVEGRGEEAAVPVLLDRWFRFRNFRNVRVHVKGPMCARGNGVLTASSEPAKKRGVEYYIRFALLLDPAPDAILILLDAERGCPRALGADLLARSRRMVPEGFPIAVVFANSGYEAWSLAAMASPKFRRAIDQSESSLTLRPLPPGTEVEAVTDCKKRVAELILGESYSPTIHQKKLTEILPSPRRSSVAPGRSASCSRISIGCSRRRGGVGRIRNVGGPFDGIHALGPQWPRSRRKPDDGEGGARAA